MADRSLSATFKYLLFIPSFYGTLSWGGWLFLYSLDLIRIDPCSNVALAIYLFVELMFLIATVYALPEYRQAIERRIVSYKEPSRFESIGAHKLLLILFHTIGFIGFVKYVNDFSKSMGGIYSFLFALLNESYMIRMEAHSTTSMGTQLSYFGWIAIGLTFYYVSGKKLSKWWFIPAVFQIAGNLTYIDRSRPFIIIITSLLMTLPYGVKRFRLSNVVKWLVAITMLAFVTFWLIAEWSGKTYYKSFAEDTVLPGITYDMYSYGVSGFAYFNKMLETREDISYAPIRTLYPLFKFTAKIGLTEEPPSKVLEFYDVPFTTNLGTFLEPFYHDGGMIFIFFGILLYSFGTNALALFFLRGTTPFSDFSWAYLCLATFSAFLDSKISGFPLWFFCGIGCVAVLLANYTSHYKKLHTIESVSK